MNNNHIVILIKEELEKFDFLSNDKRLKEQENANLLNNEDFQKQFIIDSITNYKTKIKESNSEASVRGQSDWGGGISSNINDHYQMDIEYYTTIDYLYDSQKPPIKFHLQFIGNNISISLKEEVSRGDRITPEYRDVYFDYIDWGAINVQIFDENGDEFQFTALEKENKNIQNMFMKTYLKDIIETESNITVNI